MLVDRALEAAAQAWPVCRGLATVARAVFSLLVTMAFLKVWRPAELMPVSGGPARSETRYSALEVLTGCMPFIVASALIFVTGLPAIASYLGFDAMTMPRPFLHNAVLKMPPVAPLPTPEDATVNLNFLAIPGTVFSSSAVSSPRAWQDCRRRKPCACSRIRSCRWGRLCWPSASWWVSRT